MDIYKILNKTVTLTFHLCDKTLLFFWQVTTFYTYTHTLLTQIDTDKKNTLCHHSKVSLKTLIVKLLQHIIQRGISYVMLQDS